MTEQEQEPIARYYLATIMGMLETYLIFVIFFTQARFSKNKIYSEKTRKLQQNTRKIVNFLRYYGKIHSKLPIFRVKSVKIYTGKKNLHEPRSWARDKYEVWCELGHFVVEHHGAQKMVATCKVIIKKQRMSFNTQGFGD